jgi:hypothetical protein
MLSGGGNGAARTASADDGSTPSADRAVTTKHGKHRGKGKRRR